MKDGEVDIAAALFGGGTSDDEPAKDEPAEDEESTGEQAEDEAIELTDEQAELQRRYGLSDEGALRVRGDTWAERCEDAERLAETVEAQSLPSVLAGTSRRCSGTTRTKPSSRSSQRTRPSANATSGASTTCKASPPVARTEGVAMNEKQQRDRAVLGALVPGLFDVEDASSGAPHFDGGVREPALPMAHVDPRPPTPAYREGAWTVVEVEDGAELLFPLVEVRRL